MPSQKQKNCFLTHRALSKLCPLVRQLAAELTVLQELQESCAQVPVSETGERLQRQIESGKRRIEKHLQVSARTYRDIRDRLYRLPDSPQRRVLCYRYLDGLTLGQIAEKTGCSLRLVYRLRRDALVCLSRHRAGWGTGTQGTGR